MPPLTNPDDCFPSKSRFITNFFKDGGTEYRVEVRSAYDGTSTHRLGEYVLWRAMGEDKLTVRLIEQE